MFSLIHLKYFHDAADLQSIGKAAAKNHVSPSAVSQAVRSLENFFEAELLEHARNRFTLTHQGKVLLWRSAKILEESQLIIDELKFKDKTPKGEVHLATQQSIAHHILSDFMQAFRKEYPEVQPVLKIGTTDLVKNWIENREVEFGLSVDNYGDHDFYAIPIYKGKYVFVTVPDAKKKKPTEYSFLLPGRYTRESQTFMANFKTEFGRDPDVVLEVKSWTVTKKFAEVGMGVGLIPDFLLTGSSRSSVKIIDIGLPEISYAIHALYPRRKNKLSRASQCFLDSLEKFTARNMKAPK